MQVGASDIFGQHRSPTGASDVYEAIHVIYIWLYVRYILDVFVIYMATYGMSMMRGGSN